MPNFAILIVLGIRIFPDALHVCLHSTYLLPNVRKYVIHVLADIRTIKRLREYRNGEAN